MYKELTYLKRIFLLSLLILFFSVFISCGSNINNFNEHTIVSSENESTPSTTISQQKTDFKISYDEIIHNMFSDFYIENDSKKIELSFYAGSEFDLGNNPIAHSENERQVGTVDFGKIFPIHRSYGMDTTYKTVGWESVLNGKHVVDESFFDADINRYQYTYISYSDGSYDLFYCTDNSRVISAKWTSLHNGQIFFKDDMVFNDFHVTHSKFDMQIEDVLRQETVRNQLTKSDLDLEKTKLLVVDNLGHFWGIGIILYDENVEYFMPLENYFHNINDALGGHIPTDMLEDQYKSGDIVYNKYNLYSVQEDVAPMEYAYAQAIEAVQGVQD